jgi:hypothetical protein
MTDAPARRTGIPMELVTVAAAALRQAFNQALRQLGPYLVLELVLPGGTLVALALFLYRQRQSRARGGAA